MKQSVLRDGAQLGPLTRRLVLGRAAAPAADGAAASVPGLDTAARTLELTFSSEEPVERWFGQEVLSHAVGAANFARLNDGAPLLFNHDMDDVIGVVEGAQVGADARGHAVVRFARTARGDEVMGMVADGVLRNVSFMYRVDKYQIESDDEDPYSDNDAMYTATQWMAYEISIVTVPADASVGVGRAGPVDQERPVAVAVVATRAATSMPPSGGSEATSEKDSIMTKPTVAEGTAPAAGAPADVRTDDPNRLSWPETERAIRALEARFGHKELADLLVLSQAPIEEARRAYMQATGNGGQRPVASPVSEMTEPERRRYSIVRAVRAVVNGDWREAGFEREVSETIRQRLERNPDAPKTPGGVAGGAGRSFFIPTDLPFCPDEAHQRAWLAAGGGGKLPQQRAIYQVGTAGQGGNLVQTGLLADQWIDVLRNASVTAQLGARYLTGLVGSVDIPRQITQTGTYWVGESGAITEGEATFDKVSLRIKTIAAISKMSRLMLLQSTPAIEMIAREDLLAVMALGVDLAALSGSGSANQPTGIVNQSGVGSVVGGTNGANISFDHINGLEGALTAANAPMANLGYCLNAATKRSLRSLKATTGTYLWADNGNAAGGAPTSLWGYNYALSNQLRSNLTKGSSSGVCSEVIFGNWRELLIAEWGVTEILVNPYDSTGFANGDVLIRAMQSMDIGVRHAASFAVMSDALTP